MAADQTILADEVKALREHVILLRAACDKVTQADQTASGFMQARHLCELALRQTQPTRTLT